MLKRRLLFALAGMIASFGFAVVPALFIKQGTPSGLNHWQEMCWYLACILAGAAAGALAGNLPNSRCQATIVRQSFAWSAALFLFLYVSCSALCERIHFGTIDCQWWRDAGLIDCAGGLALCLWALSKPPAPGGSQAWIKHPACLGAIMFVAAIPMVFGSWFPLLAIPGALIALKWHISRQLNQT